MVGFSPQNRHTTPLFCWSRVFSCEGTNFYLLFKQWPKLPDVLERIVEFLLEWEVTSGLEHDISGTTYNSGGNLQQLKADCINAIFLQILW